MNVRKTSFLKLFLSKFLFKNRERVKDRPQILNFGIISLEENKKIAHTKTANNEGRLYIVQQCKAKLIIKKLNRLQSNDLLFSTIYLI